MSRSPQAESGRDRPSAESPPASGPQDRPTWGGFAAFLAQRVFVYFVLYALSIGPLYWHWYRSQFVGGSGVLAAFYLPLVKLAAWAPPFGRWMDWYVNLWIA